MAHGRTCICNSSSSLLARRPFRRLIVCIAQKTLSGLTAPLIGKKAGSERKQRQLPLMARKLHANACKVAAGMIQSDAGETAVSNFAGAHWAQRTF